MNQENLQMFAHHKGGGSSANGRDSAGRRLGTKVADGQDLTAGSIIYRQRGTHIYPGVNVKKGGDDTLFALTDGVVKFERKGREKRQVSVYTREQYNEIVAAAK
ncbi:MAG: 50S ribosomal protein L27 [Leuconostoc mesenteroides]|nr:50S ribosomal protein L27 [Leuconostoc mesenteroides]MBC9722393.1 50S ribosomal protein L27 [Lactobacillus sp.]MBE4727614.1 50S ribosomal protein L27 [Leuconostoc suionicum]MBK0040160.1 50S ribosomal protein L27 [Leuconostoc sp. S51]MBK0051119.1 50S ribosomal protein L27 [Leuconostoc sp. S50]MBS0957555.1 50S ribosomal protein L27 [Leuconostoc pseudomesenteroides]MCX2666535.1 50S ribosomal protein L27 [Leuconostoc mesenteroides subsp. mesenteroides]MDN6081005.1 50S ribosomal protein L27 [L